MFTEYEDISLSNIGGGSANELFLRELKEVIRNVQDPNTSTQETRKINLTLTFKPDSEGNFFDVGISCNSKLSPIKAAKATMATDGIKGFHIKKEKDMFENVENIKK